MQVNHIQDHVSHAIIGNKVAREAEISSSAEFFNVLSNSLYSNKILAVVREVLCNAWDMHIQQGITDKPVEITLTDNKLTIRDYGTGIHDDNIVSIYLTYGNSTKKLDGTQTGGFGLGSKAPWAYVEHFEVTSWHDGQMTIYTMSKSSGEVGGKPSAMPILTVPTTETGLQVSLNIKDRGDAAVFTRIVRSIAEFGEMNVTLNGVKLETVPFSQAKHGFVMAKRIRMTNVSGGDTNIIFIRYGNVVYPVPDEPSVHNNYREVSHRIQSLGGNGYRNSAAYALILQAKPNTISVTPSRESLSMTEHTTKSINELFSEFLALFDSKVEVESYNTLEEGIAQQWIMGRPADLLTSYNQIPGLTRLDHYGRKIDLDNSPEIVTTIKEAAKAALSYSYPGYKGFLYNDTLMRLKALEVSGFGDRGKIQSFRKEFMREHKDVSRHKRYNRRTGHYDSDWFKRVLVAPLMAKLDQVEGMSGSKLLVRAYHRDRTKAYQRSNYTIIEANKLSPRQLTDYMPFLRNFVVISYNRIDIEDRLGAFPVMKHWLGNTHDMFVYIVPRTTGKNVVACDFFQSIGMTVVDLTQRQSWEPEEVLAPAPKPVVQKPRKKGLPLLSGIATPKGIKHNLIVTDENFPRIEKPEFIVQFNPRVNSLSQANIIRGLTWASIENIIRMYGSKGGVVVNENQAARFTSMGIPTLQTWLTQRISEEILTNPRLKEAFGQRYEDIPSELRLKMRYECDEVFEIILKNPILSKLYGITHNLTQEDRTVLSIFNEVSISGYYNRDANIQKALEYIKDAKVNPKCLELAEKLNKSKLISVLNRSHISSKLEAYASPAFKLTPEDEKHKQGIIDILTYAIEG